MRKDNLYCNTENNRPYENSNRSSSNESNSNQSNQNHNKNNIDTDYSSLQPISLILQGNFRYKLKSNDKNLIFLSLFFNLANISLYTNCCILY